MPDLLLAPYLPLKAPVTVGPWDLAPFRDLLSADRHEAEDVEVDARVWVPEPLLLPVGRLVEAYRIRAAGVTLGAVVVPAGGQAGDPFDRSLMPRLGHALLAGAVADNPRLATATEERSPNAGHAGATSENALLYGHPLGAGDSYVIRTGALFGVIDLRHAELDEPLPRIEPPVGLPQPIFGNFDDEVAAAVYNLLSAGTSHARQVQRALDWYRIALSNADAVAGDVRVGAARSAIEVITGRIDETKKIVRAYGALLRTEKTSEYTYTGEEVKWAKGPVQLTDDEWWLTRLSELRNAIVHGDELAPQDDLWAHDGHHQINHIHDRLIALLKHLAATHMGDDLLRLTLRERVFPRIRQELSDRLSHARASGSLTDDETA